MSSERYQLLDYFSGTVFGQKPTLTATSSIMIYFLHGESLLKISQWPVAKLEI